MPAGAGKYDGVCTAVMLAVKARTVAVLVHDGVHGSGFSVTSVEPEDILTLPQVLRETADEIERSQKDALNAGSV